MLNNFSRTELLLGTDAMKKLSDSSVAVFGIGGVGGYVVEALARSGVGAFLLVDKDAVDATNINRQIIATCSAVGRDKVDVMRERILDINPEAKVEVRKCFYLPATAAEFDLGAYDYVVDAVDTVTAKLELIVNAKAAGTPIISCMGAGNKLDPTSFKVADIYKTSVCPLAKVMRRECKKRGIDSLKVLYSTEQALSPQVIVVDKVSELPEEHKQPEQPPAGKHTTPGSVAFVPSVAGLIIAGEVVKDLVGIKAE